MNDLEHPASEPTPAVSQEPAGDAQARTRKSQEEISFGGRTLNYGMIFKFLGLLAFFALMALICYLVWPTISEIFDRGGVDLLIEKVQSAGPVGVLVLLGLQFLQIVVAFIPGEVVQIAAGAMYGPWLGMLVIFVGCVFSSAFVYWLVHKLGAPFVQAMVPEKFMERVKDFEKTGKLNFIVFILFLIPGLPKDTFTYLVPLTSMKMKPFLIVSNAARIPGILLSTYGAAHLIRGNILSGIILFVIAAGLAGIGLLVGKKYLEYKQEKEDPEGAAAVRRQKALKKAERKAKREQRKAKAARKKAAKQARGYREYQEANARLQQHRAENVRVEEHIQTKVQADKARTRWAQYRSQAREQIQSEQQAKQQKWQSAQTVQATEVQESQPARTHAAHGTGAAGAECTFREQAPSSAPVQTSQASQGAASTHTTRKRTADVQTRSQRDCSSGQ